MTTGAPGPRGRRERAHQLYAGYPAKRRGGEEVGLLSFIGATPSHELQGIRRAIRALDPGEADPGPLHRTGTRCGMDLADRPVPT